MIAMASYLELGRWAFLWRMHPWDEVSGEVALDKIRTWFCELEMYAYRSESYVFRMRLQEVDCAVVAVSTPESRQLLTVNLEQMYAGVAVERYHWCEFRAHVFSDIANGNCRGMAEGSRGNRMSSSLERVLEHAGIEDRRFFGGRANATSLVATFAEALSVLEVKEFARVFSALSLSQYCVIDVYLRTMSVKSCEESGSWAWWICNAGRVWHQRRFVPPGRWFRCPDWLSFGQRDFEVLDVPEATGLAVVFERSIALAVRVAESWMIPPYLMLDILEKYRGRDPYAVRDPHFRDAYLRALWYLRFDEGFLRIPRRYPFVWY